MPNRLATETSPYLRQHADNPVDWYPWGEEALRRAREEDKPIFLSIGYAACHWCHVMERESFEDPEVAAVLNEHFIPIKVDREERPDLDQIYMQAVVAMTGHGGWPMSVFLTPAGVPFYGGTYYPPVPRHGMPAFLEVLRALADAWRHRRDDVERGGAALLDSLRRNTLATEPQALGVGALDAAYRTLERQYDLARGGWGGAPKFPQPMTVEFLLRTHLRTGERAALTMAESTLTRMARGGIFDHLGGGFHRYATDAAWLVPHFEKMLYDNAQLARAYLHAWQVTGTALLRRVAEETLDFVVREMTDPAGGFYSSLDADSEGEEGRYYVWSLHEIREALGEDAGLFCEAYGVTERGTFEGKNILHVAQDPVALAARHGLSEAAFDARMAASRRALLARRDRRVRPGLDDKVLVAWNGLALAAFAEAARAFDRSDYRRVAEANAEFILKEMQTPDGRLLRSWRAGQARLNAYLEDYANLIDGLLVLYEATFDARWFVEARRLAEVMIRHYRDPAGGFFDTSDDHETLVVRPKDLQDNATPSGNAMAATVLLRLAALTGDGRYRDLAEAALRGVQPLLGNYPTAFAQWLCALDFALARPKEIAIIGDPVASETRALLAVVLKPYRPNQVVALGRPGEPSPIPLLEGRAPLDGHATAFVCEQFACRQPVTDPEALEAQLAS
ncbi:MAG: thioredoxin domain-containing protein [Armatimonadota bacterium]|nr:thioredoxin domain-containing protein [Armatimonadota bacterium]MDR7548858.1 thioredoxin domain-containing protein [Armatimonadota bacterium]